MIIIRFIGILIFLICCLVFCFQKTRVRRALAGYHFLASGVLKGFQKDSAADQDGRFSTAALVEYTLEKKKRRAFRNYIAMPSEDDGPACKGAPVQIYVHDEDPDDFLLVGPETRELESVPLKIYLAAAIGIFLIVIPFFLPEVVKMVIRVIVRVIGVVLILLSLACLVWRMLAHRKEVNAHRRQTGVTNGVLQDYLPEQSLRLYSPVIQFELSGKKYVEVCRDYSGILFPLYGEGTSVGTEVHVCYNPENPKDFSAIGPEEVKKGHPWYLILLPIGFLFCVLP